MCGSDEDQAKVEKEMGVRGVARFKKIWNARKLIGIN